MNKNKATTTATNSRKQKDNSGHKELKETDEQKDKSRRKPSDKRSRKLSDKSSHKEHRSHRDIAERQQQKSSHKLSYKAATNFEEHKDTAERQQQNSSHRLYDNSSQTTAATNSHKSGALVYLPHKATIYRGFLRMSASRLPRSSVLSTCLLVKSP